MADLIPVNNGQALPLIDLPLLDFDHFRERLLEFGQHGYVVQFFGYEAAGVLFVIGVMRLEDQLLAGRALLPESFPSLTQVCSKFHLFERELAEQFAVRPEGHPWLKMVRYQPNWRGKKDIFGNRYKETIPGCYPYYQVEGEEIHEVAVGPVHAGIIEPGHFRFQCTGEKVLHLEISHGYQHRGVEKLLQSVNAGRRAVIVESIAGDTTIANALSHAQAIEALTGVEVSEPAKVVRTIAMELERLSNHIGDLGALAGDVAFTPPAAFFGRMRGEFLNLLLLFCGNRFGKGLIRPGGINCQPDKTVFQAIAAKISELRPELVDCADLLLTAHTVLARFENCGTVSREAAEGLGLVGPAGRASWLNYDARVFFPTEMYSNLPPCPWDQPTGDVLARARIRDIEMRHSLDCVATLCAQGTETIHEPASEDSYPSSTFVVTINEAWRGELSHCLITDETGQIMRYKVKDPSFHNWSGLAMALRDEEISDFPVNNKSFNLSYCGMDL